MTNPKASPIAEFPKCSASSNGIHSEFSIEIRRGRTEFPSRPVGPTPFLIGSGEECDLRLGGDQIPAVHSRLFIEDNTLHVEVLASHPQLAINGRAAKQGILLDGDKLNMGSFEFVIRRHAHHAAESAPTIVNEVELGDLDDFEVDDFDVEDLAGLSAAELLDRIEKEQAFVDAFENRQRMGARALVNSVRERLHVDEPRQTIDELDAVIPIPTAEENEFADESHLSAGLQQLLVQLTSLSQALEQRSARLSRREAGYAEAVSMLLDAQEKLASQLGYLSSRLVEIQEQQGDANSTRASA